MGRTLLNTLFGLLFFLKPALVLGQSSELARLNEITLVVEDLDHSEKMLGLGEVLKDYTLGLLQAKLPRLAVNDPSAEASFLVDATFGMIEEEGKVIRYYGVLEVEVFRLVTINKTDQIIWAPVWDSQYILTGLPHEANTQVRETLDLLLNDFAAKWRRDNLSQEGENKK